MNKFLLLPLLILISCGKDIEGSKTQQYQEQTQAACPAHEEKESWHIEYYPVGSTTPKTWDSIGTPKGDLHGMNFKDSATGKAVYIAGCSMILTVK